MVLNIEIKVVLAIFFMFLIITPTAYFLNRYVTTWIETLQTTVQYLV
jgi:hypothetical protein